MPPPTLQSRAWVRSGVGTAVGVRVQVPVPAVQSPVVVRSRVGADVGVPGEVDVADPVALEVGTAIVALEVGTDVVALAAAVPTTPVTPNRAAAVSPARDNLEGIEGFFPRNN